MLGTTVGALDTGATGLAAGLLTHSKARRQVQAGQAPNLPLPTRLTIGQLGSSDLTTGRRRALPFAEDFLANEGVHVFSELRESAVPPRSETESS
ncbi:hypothetical protein ACH4PX_06530 [Streptomyces anulatus]